MGLVEDKPDITVSETVDHVRDVLGLTVAPITLWWFFDRHAVTLE